MAAIPRVRLERASMLAVAFAIYCCTAAAAHDPTHSRPGTSQSAATHSFIDLRARVKLTLEEQTAAETSADEVWVRPSPAQGSRSLMHMAQQPRANLIGRNRSCGPAGHTEAILQDIQVGGGDLEGATTGCSAYQPARSSRCVFAAMP